MKTISKKEELVAEEQEHDEDNDKREVTIRKTPKSQQFSSFRDFFLSLQEPKKEDLK